MKRVKVISKILILIMLSVNIGCVTIEERPILEGMVNKVSIRQLWGRKPDRVQYGHLKYGADELWEYEYEGSNIDRYYFKNGSLIKREHVSYDTF